ncbi:MAG: ABC transporter permease, partial [Anaerolineae bacterium]|nr:ABC transporter permease [Anaerolineae bacterium]
MSILRTRTRKILRDIVARRGRSVLVVLSILIGVFGVTAMVSISDLLSGQLQADLRPDAISHTHLYVRATGDTLSLAQNQAYLDQIAQMDGVTDVEGQGVYRVAWRVANDIVGDYDDGYMVTFTEPFGAADLEPVARVTEGRYPTPGAGEIAVEQRFADAHGVTVGDTLTFYQPDSAPQPWTVTGLVLHPYFTIDPAIQDQIPSSMALFAHYDDAQQIVGFTGLSAIHVRYTDVAAAEAGLEQLTQTVPVATPYTVVFNFLADPATNFVLNIITQAASTLTALGIIPPVVSGFLVTNVMNAIVVEQRKQIGTMKSIGATTWDNFFIYAGIALIYGLIGTLLGIALGVPLAAWLAQEMAPQAMTYIDGFKVSTEGVVVGIVMGLLVPVLAALLPVLAALRVSLLEAITDLGIASSWGRSRLSRWIGNLPFPTVIVQGISSIYQKRGRLVLTGLTLTMAAAAFMGVTALDTSLADFVDRLDDPFAYEIAITPQDTHDFATVETLLRDVDGVAAVYPGYSAAVSVAGFESANPLTAGSDLVTVTGIDPARSAIT